jgi:hypothetical protein
MSTTKTVLIVAGVGVGAFVLFKLLSPSPAVRQMGSVPNSTANVLIGGLLSAGGNALSSYLSRPSTPVAPADSAAVYRPGESFGDYTSSIFGPGINPDGTGA